MFEIMCFLLISIFFPDRKIGFFTLKWKLKIEKKTQKGHQLVKIYQCEDIKQKHLFIIKAIDMECGKNLRPHQKTCCRHAWSNEIPQIKI